MPILLAQYIERLGLGYKEILGVCLGRSEFREVRAERVELGRSEIRLVVGVGRLDLSDDSPSPDDDIDVEARSALTLGRNVEGASRVSPRQVLFGEEVRNKTHVIVRIAQRILDPLEELEALAGINELLREAMPLENLLDLP